MDTTLIGCVGVDRFADLFDCSPKIAAKIARCAEMQRSQLRYGLPIAPYTDEDAAILNRISDKLYQPAHWTAAISFRAYLNA